MFGKKVDSPHRLQVKHKGQGETLFSEITTEGGIAGIARHRRHRRHRKNSPQKGDLASWCFLRLESPRPCCDEARQCASRRRRCRAMSAMTAILYFVPNAGAGYCGSFSRVRFARCISSSSKRSDGATIELARGSMRLYT